MRTIPDILRTILTTLTSLNPMVGSVVAVGTIIVGVIGYVREMWAEIFTRLDVVVIAAAPTLGISPFRAANAMFPLDQLFTYLTAYFALFLVCTGIRIIKSFVPSISG